MRKLLTITLWVGLVAANLPAGTVSYDFSTTPIAPPADAPAGSTVLQVTYLLSNFTFLANEELDIAFDPTLYGALSNGQAPSGFSLNLFQPDSPPGAPGDFSALATINNPSLTGSFSADVVFYGTGQPGPQSYSINQYDAQDNFVDAVSSGSTTPATNTPVPEPSSFWLGGMGLVIGAGRLVSRYRSRSAV
jgi:hypothetical protein